MITVGCPEGARGGPAAGFTLVELMVVVAIVAVATGMAVLVTNGAIRAARSDSAMTALMAELRLAREMAVSQRRDFEVRFVGTNEVEIYRLGIQAGTTPELVRTTRLEMGHTFTLFSDLPDTPDGFGKTAAISFGSATTLIFRSEGMFTDANANLDPISGTVFIGVGVQKLSARAVTIFGPSALVRGYRWTGTGWVE